MGRQLAAMPCELYLIRLIHHRTRRAFPGERLWTATQLRNLATVRFLRIRNREGCDIYIQPYAEDRNAGYVLVDLDQADPTVLESMRTNGHEPCVVLQTSPGNLQAWIHVSPTALEPAGRPPSGASWPAAMAATWPVPTGAIWAGWPVSPTGSLSEGCPAEGLPGLKSSRPGRGWRPMPAHCS